MTKMTKMTKMAKNDKTRKGMSRKGMTHPSPGQHRSLHNAIVGRTDVTEADDCLLRAFRLIVKAGRSRKAFAKWSAWEMLKSEVVAQNRGITPSVEDVEEDPTLYAAVTAIRAYLASERKKTKAGTARSERATDGAKRAKQSKEGAPTSCEQEGK